MADESVIKELNAVIEKINPNTVNGCVCLHFNKKTMDLDAVSPMLPANNIKEMIQQLDLAERAIRDLKVTLINREVSKNNGKGTQHN